jgi:DNA-binding response OmpR family regulator
MGNKILIIEDEVKVANFIKVGLEEFNYVCDIAEDGEKGKTKALNNKYNIIIMDLNLPIINGFDLCRLIRLKNNDVPILMLTALGTTEDKLAGFEIGADDYLVKPFEFRELLARIKSLIKRSSLETSNGLITISNLELNTETKIVKRGNKRIDLTAKEFMLLEFFMRNPDRIISRMEIAEKIWEVSFDTGTNVIDVYINFLRKKIDKDFSPKLLYTQIGMGYIFKDKE